MNIRLIPLFNELFFIYFWIKVINILFFLIMEFVTFIEEYLTVIYSVKLLIRFKIFNMEYV